MADPYGETCQRPRPDTQCGYCQLSAGGKSRRHHHAGSVYAYVLSGAVRSENSATAPVKVYTAGEGFFDRPAARTSPAKMRAPRSRAPRRPFPRSSHRARRRMLHSRRVERRPPAALVVTGELKVEALVGHADCYVSDAGPG